MRALYSVRLCFVSLAVVVAGLLAGCSPAENFQITIAATGSQNEQADLLDSATLVADFEKIRTDDKIWVDLVDGSGRRVLHEEITPDRHDGTIDYDSNARAIDFGHSAAQIVTAFDRMQSSATGSNLITAWNAVMDSPPQQAIFVTSGVLVSDPLDERKIGLPGTESEAVRMLAALTRNQELAPAKNASVLFVGVGITHAPQPAPQRPDLLGLRAMLMGLCHTAQAGRCEFRSPAESPDGPAANALPAAVLKFPSERTNCDKVGTAHLSIPNSFLGFSQGSSALGPTADQTLQPDADVIARYRVSTLVIGYTSPEGSLALNQKLRADRAAVVGQELHRLGVPTTLLGSRDGGPARGHVTLADYPRWRRVDIQVRFGSVPECRQLSSQFTS